LPKQKKKHELIFMENQLVNTSTKSKTLVTTIVNKMGVLSKYCKCFIISVLLYSLTDTRN